MAKAVRYFCGTITRETAKAVLVDYIAYEHRGEYVHVEVWLPKSQIEVYKQYTDGDMLTIWRVPLWLVNKNNLTTITKKAADMD